MKDPPRLIDESSSEIEVALLHAGREYRSRSSARTKTLAALGLVGSAGLVAKSSAAASLWSLKSWLLGGAVVGVAAVAVVFSTHLSEPSRPSVTAPPSAVQNEPARAPTKPPDKTTTREPTS